jgi:DNA-binding XRE family transcriptional regulator
MAADKKFELNLIITGERLSQVRSRLGIMQKEAAKLLGIDLVSMNRLEKGKGASIVVFFNYLNLLIQKGVYIPAIFEENFDVENAFNPNKTIIKILKKDISNKKTLSFSNQIEDLLIRQRDKASQFYDELLEITGVIAKLQKS